MNSWTYFDALGRLLPMAMPTGGNGLWPQLPPNPALGPNPFASLPAAYASALAALDPAVSGTTAYPLAGYAPPLPPSITLQQSDPSAASSWLPTSTPTSAGRPAPFSYSLSEPSSPATDDSLAPPVRYDPAKYSMFARMADFEPPAEPQDPYASLPLDPLVRVAAAGMPTWPTRPRSLPGPIPPEAIEEWWKHTVWGHQGLFDFLYQMWQKSIGGVGSRRGRDDDDDKCNERWQREYGRCPEFKQAHYRYQLACEARAGDRLSLCIKNKGKPSWDEPPEYGWDDVPEDFPRE
jgi:hypothetical protein